MNESTFTLHLFQRADGTVKVKAIDDRDNYQIEAEYESLSIAALEGVIALNARRIDILKEANVSE